MRLRDNVCIVRGASVWCVLVQLALLVLRISCGLDLVLRFVGLYTLDLSCKEHVLLLLEAWSRLCTETVPRLCAIIFVGQGESKVDLVDAPSLTLLNNDDGTNSENSSSARPAPCLLSDKQKAGEGEGEGEGARGGLGVFICGVAACSAFCDSPVSPPVSGQGGSMLLKLDSTVLKNNAGEIYQVAHCLFPLGNAGLPCSYC